MVVNAAERTKRSTDAAPRAGKIMAHGLLHPAVTAVSVDAPRSRWTSTIVFLDCVTLFCPRSRVRARRNTQYNSGGDLVRSVAEKKPFYQLSPTTVIEILDGTNRIVNTKFDKKKKTTVIGLAREYIRATPSSSTRRFCAVRFFATRLAFGRVRFSFVAKPACLRIRRTDGPPFAGTTDLAPVVKSDAEIRGWNDRPSRMAQCEHRRTVVVSNCTVR